MNDYPYRIFKYISNQVTEEGGILLLLYNMTRGLKPNIIVEIGTGTSHTTSAFLEALDEINKPALLYTIDPNPHIEKSMVNHPFLCSYIGTSDEAFNIWGKNRSIDLLYIDGNHHYEQFKRDFEQWSKYLSNNGYILIHDTNNHWWPDIPIVIKEIRNTNQWDMIELPYGYGIVIMHRRQNES